VWFPDIGGDDGDEAGFVDDASQHAVSRSYEWLLAVLNHLSSKCLCGGDVVARMRRCCGCVACSS
jgi:hypothetical protein